MQHTPTQPRRSQPSPASSQSSRRIPAFGVPCAWAFVSGVHVKTRGPEDQAP